MTVRRGIPATIWLGLVLIVVPGLLLVMLEMYIVNVKVPSQQRQRELVLRALDVMSTAELLRGAVNDAERAQRGYLLTGDRDYLAPYDEGAVDAPKLLAKLKQLTADSPEQQRRIPTLAQQIDVKFRELASTLAMHDRQGTEAARVIVRTDAGLHASEAIMGLLDAAVAAEKERLTQHSEELSREEQSSAYASAAAGMLAFAVMAVGATLLLLAFRDTRRAEEAKAESDRRLRDQQAELAQYQKMESLGQLTGGIAHDFNNLIHVIKNALELVQRRLKPADPEIRGYLEMADRNADRAASLTQRLLAFSRRQVLDPKPIDPNTLLAELTSLLVSALGESIAIETISGAGAWWIQADVNQLETAMLNLALNARDAMPGGGKLTIEVTNAYLDDSYAAGHSEVKPGQYVMIALSDTGTGMPKEVAERAFEPFFTTKEMGRGTGLGLSQVYGFAKQSHGHAKLYSEPGQGTTAKLYLPRLLQGAPAEAPPLPAETLFHDGAGAVILVVEDDEDVRAFTVEVLAALGYAILAAEDAAAALRLLEASKVDLLFTDVGLPNGKNGRQLADEARQRWPALKVLFTTGYTRNAIIHHGRLDTGVELIPKPFTQSSLAAKVRRVLAA